MLKDFFSNIAKTHIDWLSFASACLLVSFGLVTMNSFSGENLFYEKQLIWFLAAIIIFFVSSFVDWSFLKRTQVLVGLFIGIVTILSLLFVIARTVKGAQSWIHLGFFSFQPVDPAKLILVLILAKYFSRRHVEIARIRHILVSGLYAFVLFVLVALQPDFGGAVIILIVWLGMTLVSGISKKHLAVLALSAVAIFGLMWNYGFKAYQRDRVLNFIHPLADIQGTGYNAFQSTIAVGSGELFGKGIGYGTQSRLKFLPEYQTDFVFAAFAEEWGFIGVLFLLGAFALLIWRIVANGMRGQNNFEILYAFGIAILFMGHFFINIAMNMGLLPVTGITLPFVSYGGSHLITSFFALGILNSMRRYMATVHKDRTHNELLGI